MIQPWDRVESERMGDYTVFQVRQDQSRSPRSGAVHTFHVIEATDWVNVIPVTAEGQIVFVRQYRHGIGAVTLEIPGGMIDPGETPAEAARREMREETGYAAAQVIHLGGIAPNPAMQNNVCYSYLALDAHPEGPLRLDGAEDIDVVLVDPADVPALIAAGSVNHALVVTAFYLYDQYRHAVQREEVGGP